MKKTWLLLLLLQVYASGLSGSPGRNEHLKLKYARHNAVVTKKESLYVFDIVKDSLVVQQHETKEVLILNDHSKGLTNDYVFGSSFTTIENIQAATHLPEGKRFKKIDVTQFNESHDRDGSIFYDDATTTRFSYPSLKEDAVTSLRYSIRYNDPRFLRRFYFQSFIPTVHSKVTVKAHSDIKISYRLFHDDPERTVFRQYSRGKYNYMEWEMTDIEPYKYLGTNHFSINYHSPHLSLYIDQYNVNGTEESYYGTVDELYRYYYSFIERMPESDSEELKLLVLELTAGLTDIEKARAIYYWVQKNIKYVAYLQGYMGFIPVPAHDVFTKRFGDCKGMTSLIVKMMELAGLTAHYSWVGTRDIPYSYEELPLPVVDNHMIAVYIHNDSVFVMDGTFSYLDLGTDPWHILGKEILIGIDREAFRIHNVPASEPSHSSVTDSVIIAMTGNTLRGKGHRKHEGFNKVELAMAMEGVRRNDYNKVFTRLFSKGNNKFTVDGLEIINLFEYDSPGGVIYEFSLDDYLNTLGDEIYINLNLDRSYQGMKIDTTGLISPVVNDFPFTERHVTRFEIPEGYSVAYLPDDDSYNHEDFRFSIRYSQDGSFVMMEKEIIFDFLILFKDKFSEWNRMIDRLNRNYRSTTVLRKDAVYQTSGLN
jgi:transglutaminase-like putative cysteine protease